MEYVPGFARSGTEISFMPESVLQILHPADPIIAAAMLQTIRDPIFALQGNATTISSDPLVWKGFDQLNERSEATNDLLTKLFRINAKRLTRPPEMNSLCGYLAEEVVCLSLLFSMFHPSDFPNNACNFRDGIPYVRFSEVMHRMGNDFGFSLPTTQHEPKSTIVVEDKRQLIVSAVQFVRINGAMITPRHIPWLLIHRTGLVVSGDNKDHVADIFLPAKRLSESASVTGAVTADQVANGTDALISIQVKYCAAGANGSLIKEALEGTRVPMGLRDQSVTSYPMALILQENGCVAVSQPEAAQGIHEERVYCATIPHSLYVRKPESQADPRHLMNFVQFNPFSEEPASSSDLASPSQSIAAAPASKSKKRRNDSSQSLGKKAKTEKVTRLLLFVFL